MPDTILGNLDHRKIQRCRPVAFTERRRTAEAIEPFFELWRAVIETRRAFSRAQEAEQAAFEVAARQYPERPAHLFLVRELADGSNRRLPVERLDIEDWIRDARTSRASRVAGEIAGFKALLRDLDAYEAQRAVVDRKVGLTAIRAEAEAAEKALDLAEERLAKAPATSPRAIAIKLRFGLRRFYCSPRELSEPAPQIVQSTIRDLVRLRRFTREQSHA